MRCTRSALAVLSVTCVVLPTLAPAPTQLLALADVSVVDVREGRVPADMTVVLSGDRIKGIGSGTEVGVPQDTVRYTLMPGGTPSGERLVWTDPEGVWHSRLDFRGSLLDTRADLDSAGMPVRMAITGMRPGREPLAWDERFELDGGLASWSTPAEEGSASTIGPAFYVPGRYTPPFALHPLVVALGRRPDRSVSILPEGEVRMEALERRTIEVGGRSRTLRLHALHGLDLAPEHVWLDEDGSLFADDVSILEGWEAAFPELAGAATEALAEHAWRVFGELVPAARERPLVIHGARLFDPERRSVLDGMTVVVRGNRIHSVGADGSLEVPEEADVIDAAGRTLLPGLWDMHVHLNEDFIEEMEVPLFVAAGVTTVRDLGSRTDFLSSIRRRAEADRAIAPRILPALILYGPGEWGLGAGVGTVEEVHAALDRFAALGYVQVKMYNSVPPELVPVIVERARSHGMRVSGHLPNGMSLRDALEHGFDEIQHLFYARIGAAQLRGLTPDDDPGARMAAVHAGSSEWQDLVELLRLHDVVVDPTIAVVEETVGARPPVWLGRVLDRFPPQAGRAALHGVGPDTPPAMLRDRWEDVVGNGAGLLRSLHEAGIRIVAGTDGPIGGFELHRELELYVEAGLPASEVLHIATLGAARTMGMEDELGSIEPGKLADLILVDGNPDVNISDIRRVVTVISNGRVHDPAAIYRAVGIEPVPGEGASGEEEPPARATATDLLEPGSQQERPILGSLHFPTSGSEDAHAEFELGVLALHSVWYEEARDRFRRALEVDPDFAMAYWGEAMTWDPAVGGLPEPDATRAVLARLAEREVGGTLRWTERERQWIQALRLLWAGKGDLADRRSAHAEAMTRLAHAHPRDDEARLFASLARSRAFGYRTDEPEAFEALVTELEDLFHRNPDHPGAAHYLIHALDWPGAPNAAELARRALPAARAYASIAPNSSHAVHMPSHIFRELGMWAEMAASNERADEVSVGWQSGTGRPLAARDWHAIDWLHSAYVKLGRFQDAAELIAELDSLVEVAAAQEEPLMPMLGLLGIMQARHADASRMVGMPVHFPVREIPELAGLPPAHEMQVLMATGWRAALAGQTPIVEGVAERLRALAERPDAGPPGFLRFTGDMIDGELLLARGDTASALAHTREMLANSGDPPFFGAYGMSQPEARIAEIQLARGLASDDADRIREAADIYDQLLAQAPRDGALLLGRVRAAQALEDADGARLHLGRVREIWASADAALVDLTDVDGSADIRNRASPPTRSAPDRFVEIGGVRLHYLDFGGSGLPLVFVHSEAWDARTFAEFAPRFADRNRVLAVTRPGYGESEPHPDGFGVDVQARSLVGFLDAMGIEQAVFAGNASATSELTYLAEHHPERVAGLVYLTGLAVPWVDAHESDPTRAFEMFMRANPGSGDEAARVRARREYRPEFVHGDRPPIGVPALAFVARSGTMGQEHAITALALVGSPLMREVRSQMPPSPVRDHLERLAADEAFRRRELEQIPDPAARAYFLRLAADDSLQAEVQRHHEETIRPAVLEGQEEFRRAFGEYLHLVRLNVEQVVGYEYRDAPELIEPHVRRFLERVNAAEAGSGERFTGVMSKPPSATGSGPGRHGR
jgi:imidazolonepropionase-like amidohydrolase/pimeloyl-ACP methyl ester carboxylesterase